MKRALLACLLIFSFQGKAEDVPGQTLLNYYSGSCKKGKGQWTDIALAQSTALIRTVEQIAKDPDCSTAVGAMSQLQSLQVQLTAMERMNSTKNTITEINAKEQELLIQLSKSTDSGTISEVNAKLRELQVQRAALMSRNQHGKEIQGADKAAVMYQVAVIANSSFQQLTSSQKCLDKHPEVLESATSMVAGVGAAVSVVNPAVGLIMTAGATFAKTMMDGIRGRKLSRKIRNIADSTITFEAYMCALESMSNNWCQMTDAQEFLDFRSRNRIEETNDPQLSQAISLNDREIPVILEWLNRIRNGVSPMSPEDAERKIGARERVFVVEAKWAFAQGVIEKRRAAYDKAKTPEEKWEIIKPIIMTLAPQSVSINSNGMPKTDPLTDLISPKFSPFYLVGYDDENNSEIRNTNKELYTFSDWPKPATVNPTLNDVKSRYSKWVDRAMAKANFDLTQEEQPDPLRTLSSCQIVSEPIGIEPCDALNRVVAFLEKNPHPKPAFRTLYEDTIKRLRLIHDTAIASIATSDPRTTDEEGKTPIERIYTTAQLNYGVIVLQERLEVLVRLSLMEYIQGQSEETQVLVAQFLAADRFTDTLSRISGTTSIAQLKKDLSKGKAYTLENLNSFMDLFGHNINRSLHRYYNEEKVSLPSEARGKRDLRTSMCFLALGAPNATDWIDTRLCEGLKMEAAERGGPESITLTANTFTLDLKDRACIYTEYFRQSDIYQKWRIKN